MKAILVIDMPKKCVLCKFGALNGNCWIVGQYHGYKDERPAWCPLRPLPSKGTMENVVECEYNRGFIDGRNHCLELITGETECTTQKMDT